MPKRSGDAWAIGGKVRAPSWRRGTEWIRISSSPAQPSARLSRLLGEYTQAGQRFGQNSDQARAAGRRFRDAYLGKKESIDLSFGFRVEAGSWRWTGFLIESSTELSSKQLKSLPMIGSIADLARGMLELGKPVRVTAMRRRGRAGHTREFWQQIQKLHEQAMKASPRKPVAWLRANLPSEHRSASEDTVRRWVRLIRQGKKP